jgi:nitrite reductase/ring-hydroxylating ferredoxin subunit
MSTKYSINDIRLGEFLCVNHNGRELILARTGVNDFFVFDRKCPHLGCDLCKVGIIIKNRLICQCHYSEFSLIDGSLISGPSSRGIKVYKYLVKDGYIIILDNNLIV